MTTTSRVGHRELDAEAAGDLVAHAGIAVFEVVAAGLLRLPELVQFARQAAGGVDHDRVGRGHALHGADHLRVGRRHGVGRASDRCRGFGPGGAAALRSPWPPGRASVCQPASAADSSSSPARASATSGSGAVLVGVEGLHVEADDAALGIAGTAPTSRW